MLPFLASMVALTAVPQNPVSVHLESYRGWKGCYRLSNGLVDLVVVPQVGRIMRFGEVSRQNLLWEASQISHPVSGQWNNWGGDKVWPAPQAKWGWPPEKEYDGDSWDAQIVANGVRMVSRSRSQKLGLRFSR